MVQRILLAACLSLTTASLGLAGLAWQQSNRTAVAAAEGKDRLAELFAQTHAASQAKVAELLAKTEATNEEILKHLKATGKTAQSPDWIPVSFKLTQETLDGPPAVGFTITLASRSAGLLGGLICRESDSNGLADFGVVHPGDWSFTLSKPWDEKHAWECEGSINVLPETRVVQAIICPRTPPAQSRVTLRVRWPDDLAPKTYAWKRPSTTRQPVFNRRLDGKSQRT